MRFNRGRNVRQRELKVHCDSENAFQRQSKVLRNKPFSLGRKKGFVNYYVIPVRQYMTGYASQSADE